MEEEVKDGGDGLFFGNLTRMELMGWVRRGREGGREKGREGGLEKRHCVCTL